MKSKICITINEGIGHIKRYIKKVEINRVSYVNFKRNFKPQMRAAKTTILDEQQKLVNLTVKISMRI